MLLPFPSTQSLEGLSAEIVLVRTAPEWQMCQFQRNDDAAIDHQGGAQAGAEAEKQQQSALVAPERLHGGIVDDPDRAPERRLEVESHPAATEVAGFGDDAPLDDSSRVADRDRVVLPVRGEVLDRSDHPARRQPRAGGGLPWFLLSS